MNILSASDVFSEIANRGTCHGEYVVTDFRFVLAHNIVNSVFVAEAKQQ